MKKLYFLIAFIFITGFANAQEEQPSAKKQADIEALKVAFISKELELTPGEAQQFWPLYNQYYKELKAIRQANPDDMLEKDEKVLALRKNYKDQFTKIIGPPRVNKMYNAEGKFHQLLFRAMRKQNQNRPNAQPFKKNH